MRTIDLPAGAGLALTFDVVGLPAPKGSSRAMVRGGRAVNVPSGSNVARDKLRGWAAEVTTQAVLAMGGAPPTSGQAIGVTIAFRFPRLKAHIGKGGIKPAAPKKHTSKPDLDKLVRSTWDAMAGIVYDDDSRIADLTTSKVYCDPGEMPGATITIRFPEAA